MDLNQFPLIKLPILAIAVILRNMGLMDILFFSRLSNKAKRIVKGNFKARGYTMEIFVPHSFSFEVENPNQPKIKISVTNDSMGTLGFNQTVGGTSGVRSLERTEEGKRTLWMHWNDKFAGFKIVYEEFFYIFAIPITNVVVDLDYFGEEHKELIRWLNSLQPSKFTILGQNCDFATCMWMLENAKSIEEVSFLAEPREYLEAEPYTIEAKSLDILYGQWVKPAHIQRMNSKDVGIYMMNLTDAQVIEILNNLRNGSNSNLEAMRLTLNRQLGDLLEIIFELDNIEIHENTVDLKLNDERMCTLGYLDLAEEGAEHRVGIKIDIKRDERRENN